MRRVFDALLPPGSIWSPQFDGDFDKLLDGVADNATVVKEFLASLAHIRDPLLTPILDDLEREFGIIPSLSLSEEVRRARLQVVKTDGNSDGTAEFMQEKLRAAGFDLYVYENYPVIDPATILNFSYDSVFNDGSVFADGTVFSGKSSGLIVNGPVYDNQVEIVYALPPADYWPLVFFIGGEATRNIDGEIISLADAEIPISRRVELRSLIVKYKPMHTWCAPAFTYISG